MGEITEIRAYPPQEHSTAPFSTAIVMKGLASGFQIEDATGREICTLPVKQGGLTQGAQASNALLFGASAAMAQRLWEACAGLDALLHNEVVGGAIVSAERRALQALIDNGREALRAGGIRP